MSRRKKHSEHANHERWLVSYADFITLMFAFFVVMYSSAQVDQRKVGRLALAIQVAFQELGVFPASTSAVPIASQDPMPFSDVQQIARVERVANLGRIAPEINGKNSVNTENPGLRILQKELEQALAPEILRHEVALRVQPNGLVVSLREIGFFASGSAQLRANSVPAVNRIASLLMERQYQVRIEGHTDNVPIHTAQFASNWELSTARSTELVRLLILKHGFAPMRLSAAGYAEFHPIASNSTEQGRALNRRVDIVILGREPDQNAGDDD
jgi:chemotaxis protein MotB